MHRFNWDYACCVIKHDPYAHLRLVFPTLAKNDSPLSLLPQFLQVLGKKLENAMSMQDFICVQGARVRLDTSALM